VLFTSYGLDKNTTCAETARTIGIHTQVTRTEGTELVSMWT